MHVHSSLVVSASALNKKEIWEEIIGQERRLVRFCRVEEDERKFQLQGGDDTLCVVSIGHVWPVWVQWQVRVSLQIRSWHNRVEHCDHCPAQLTHCHDNGGEGQPARSIVTRDLLQHSNHCFKRSFFTSLRQPSLEDPKFCLLSPVTVNMEASKQTLTQTGHPSTCSQTHSI